MTPISCPHCKDSELSRGFWTDHTFHAKHGFLCLKQEPAPVATGEDGFTVIELANVMIGIVCLAIIGFIVYVAGHFIQKVW